MPELLANATAALALEENVIYVDSERNTRYYVDSPHSEVVHLWSCGLRSQQSFVSTRGTILQECEECENLQRGRWFTNRVHELFDNLPQAVELPDSRGVGHWLPFNHQADTDIKLAVEEAGRKQRDIQYALNDSRRRWKSTFCHFWIGCHHTTPFATKPLNLEAYLALQGCGAPTVLLTTKHQPHWMVTRSCGWSVAKWQQRAQHTPVTWHQVRCLLWDHLQEIHARGWAIRTAMTPESVWFDSDPGEELNTETCPPPYGFGRIGGFSWASVNGAYFVDLREAGPAMSADEQADDVKNLEHLFETTSLAS